MLISDVGYNEPVLDAVTYVSMYSKPLGAGNEPVVPGSPNKLPDGSIPNKPTYKSSTLKLF